MYAAESRSGRIKRFSADGELLQLVGAVDLVPGCKNVSIAVAEDGNQVFMLDITRNHIVVMEPVDAVAGDKNVDEPANSEVATTDAASE